MWCAMTALALPAANDDSNDEETLRRAVSRLGVAGYVCKGDLADLRAKVPAILRRDTDRRGHVAES